MDDVQSIDGSSGTYRTGSEADPPTAALKALHRAHQDIHNTLAAWLKEEGFPDLLVAESSSWRDCDKPLCLDASRAAENSRGALLARLQGVQLGSQCGFQRNLCFREGSGRSRAHVSARKESVYRTTKRARARRSRYTWQQWRRRG
jgi:hypothetical protein